MNCGLNFVNFIIYTVYEVLEDLVNNYGKSINSFVDFKISGVIIGDLNTLMKVVKRL